VRLPYRQGLEQNERRVRPILSWAWRMNRANSLETFKSLMYEMAKQDANHSKCEHVRAINAKIKDAGIRLPTVGK
jgi:hypothetical protein